MPVDFTSLSAKQRGCDVELDWTTVKQLNFSHYEIEWSEDSRAFEKVGTITGIENTNGEQKYSFTHEAATESNYYRLKMVDLDGTYEYSKVVFIELNCELDLNIYPNPSPSDAIVNVNLTPYQNNIELEIIDVLGKVVRQVSYEVEPNISTTVQISTANLPSGA